MEGEIRLCKWLKNRRFLVSSNKLFVKPVTNYNMGLPVNFTKVTDGTYILVFENLEKGEYAIIASSDVYSFRVI